MSDRKGVVTPGLVCGLWLGGESVCRRAPNHENGHSVVPDPGTAEPRTDEGRTLLKAWPGLRRSIIAIEEQAATEVRRELAVEYEAAAARADESDLGTPGVLIAKTWRQAATMARRVQR